MKFHCLSGNKLHLTNIFFYDQAGPRICLGKEFAYRQMKIMAATLIHFFRFKLADESKDPTYKTTFTLHIDNGLYLRAYPRSA
jgi:cytochrome P450